ncbi:oligosaccharide flippase family protein [Marinobacter metalliresistant]|uniref:Oligosaccharide flippase family protein n=1 Tax=Marinobacter metalliresistant TaxID=2961995 RepID=A0ABZ2W4V4_9GAMM
MKAKDKLISGLLGVGAIKLLSIPVGLLSSVILARTLGPDSFGQYAFIMALIPILSLPVNGGVQQLVTREVATLRNDQDWSRYKGLLHSAHIWVLGLSALLVGACYFIFSSSVISLKSDKWHLLPIAILIVPLLGFMSVRAGLIKGLGRPVLSEIPQQLIVPILTFVLILVFWQLNILNASNAIWANIYSALFGFVVASLVLRFVNPSEIKQVLPSYKLVSWFKSLLPFTALAAINLVNVQVGIIVVGMLSSNEQVAALRIAERGSQLVLLSLTIVNMVVAPYFVDAYKKGDRNILREIAQKTARFAFLISLPVALVFVFAGEPLIGLIFGQEYRSSSYTLLLILSLAQLVNVFFGSVGYLLVMTGHEKDSLFGQVLALTLNILISLVLVPFWGATGAAIAVFVSIFVWNAVLLMLVIKRLGIRCSVF